MASAPPVFVVGMPRSGTTLLARLLEAGASYTALPESHFFSRFVWISVHRRTLPGLEAAWNEFARACRWPLAYPIGCEPADAAARIAPERYRRIFQAWVSRELAEAGRSPGGSWIENSPPHLEGLPFIRCAFPKARIVGVIRDPRAVHASLAPLDWNNAHAAANAERWRWYARALHRLADEDPERVRVLAYEALVRRPVDTLTALAHWLDVPFDASVLARAAAHTHGFDVAMEPWKARALRPPDPQRIDNWRTTLTDADIAAIERWAWPAAAAYGYAAVTGDRSRPPFEEWRAGLMMRARLTAYAAATALRVATWRCRR